MKTIKWGILAPGNIAHKFATALAHVEGAALHTVASRDPARARAFQQTHNATTYAEDYAQMIADPELDVIYIASPHRYHAEQTLDCLQAGKAVLCEKPLTVNLSQAEAVFAAAEQHNVFYMEAVWTRFMPIYKQVSEWVSEGKIGNVGAIQASFGINVPFDAAHRLYAPELAGGALLDLGIYPITVAQIVTDQAPDKVVAAAQLGESGVDEATGMVLHYPNGIVATLNCGTRATSSLDCWILGDQGSIHIPQFWQAESATLYQPGEGHHSTARNNPTECQLPHDVNGYEYEIREVNRCLRAGLLESPLMRWQHSRDVMRIMDTVRSQIGLKFPFE
ncbi:dehydrogenase [Arenicella chitinivorans]|uniref:Dehydrogenase n=1 Tax=Arenicella chitinivorans TaxID=1329800 RepID=A0A918VIJ7_9GAMM|nr:Gfo/Idh/MocA family oxidoreductase [Arenicella chitinivorans]GHA01627.1 dehydrogenase [Arenicella chitinivorans]